MVGWFVDKVKGLVGNNWKGLVNMVMFIEIKWGNIKNFIWVCLIILKIRDNKCVSKRL